MAYPLTKHVLHPHPAPDEGQPLPGSGRGRSHGTSRSAPFDRWFRYPAGFASDYAASLLQHARLQPGELVIDCFAGSAVTGTAARQSGLRFTGIEAHPLIAELGHLKLAGTHGLEHLVRDAHAVEQAAIRQVLAGDVSADVLAQEPELIRRSFDQATLALLVALKFQIQGRSDLPTARYLKWALLACLRDVAAVKVGWPYQRPGVARKPRFASVSARFLTRVGMMAQDIAAYAHEGRTGQVIVGDSRAELSWEPVEPGSAAACVSSPPYLNNFDYADATRLEVFFWGEATTWAQLVTQIRGDMLTATTQQSSVAGKAAAVATLDRTAGSGEELTALTEALRLARRSRARGKEYDQVLPAYFVGMESTLRNTARALAPGALCVWLIGDSAPYGVYVDTPRLTGEIAMRCGFSVLEDQILRHRGLRWATAADRHDVALSERLLIMRRDG